MFDSIAKIKILQYTYRLYFKFKKLYLEGFISHLKFASFIKQKGANSYCHFSVEIKYGDRISIGENSVIGPYCVLGGFGNIFIGKNVVLSRGVVIETAGLDFKYNVPPYKHLKNRINIEDNVWIGLNSIILGGVCIGENSIIGAGSIITKDVPKNTVVVGNGIRKEIDRDL